MRHVWNEELESKCSEQTALYKSLPGTRSLQNRRSHCSRSDQTWSWAIGHEANTNSLRGFLVGSNKKVVYQPSDAELSKTKSKAVEQISAQVGPILDLIVSVPCYACFMFCSCSWLSWQSAQRPPRKARSAGQRTDGPVNWSNTRRCAVCLRSKSPQQDKNFLRLLWDLRERKKGGREGSFLTWLIGDAFKFLVLFNGNVWNPYVEKLSFSIFSCLKT